MEARRSGASGMSDHIDPMAFADDEVEWEASQEQRKPNGHDLDPPRHGWQPIVIDVGEDLDPIPPRGWLLGNSFCREFVSSVFAAGSTGKTALRVAQLLSLATGKPLTGEYVFQRCRVMMIGLEDGIDELRRRVRAAMIHYGVKPEDIKGWFHIAQLPPTNSKLILEKGNETLLRGWLEKQIVEKRLDIVCLDPLVKLHDMPENG
jgi:AAA domain